MLDRVLKRLAPERVVFSALGLREGLIYSQLSEAERYLDPLVEGAQLIGLPLARVPQFAPALVRWTAALFPGETPRRDAAARRGLRAVRSSSGAIRRRCGIPRVSGASCSFPFIGVSHAERAFLAAAHPFPLLRASANAPWLEPAISLLSPAQRGARKSSAGRCCSPIASRAACRPFSRARVSTSRADKVTLSADAARAPDSEVVGDRLKLLAAALGVKKWEIAAG